MPPAQFAARGGGAYKFIRSLIIHSTGASACRSCTALLVNMCTVSVPASVQHVYALPTCRRTHTTAQAEGVQKLAAASGVGTDQPAPPTMRQGRRRARLNCTPPRPASASGSDSNELSLASRILSSRAPVAFRDSLAAPLQNQKLHRGGTVWYGAWRAPPCPSALSQPFIEQRSGLLGFRRA